MRRTSYKKNRRRTSRSGGVAVVLAEFGEYEIRKSGSRWQLVWYPYGRRWARSTPGLRGSVHSELGMYRTQREAYDAAKDHERMTQTSRLATFGGEPLASNHRRLSHNRHYSTDDVWRLEDLLSDVEKHVRDGSMVAAMTWLGAANQLATRMRLAGVNYPRSLDDRRIRLMGRIHDFRTLVSLKKMGRNPATPLPPPPPTGSQKSKNYGQWLEITYAAGTPVKFVGFLPVTDDWEVSPPDRGEVDKVWVEYDAAGEIYGTPKVFVKVVDSRDENGYRMDDVVGKVIPVSGFRVQEFIEPLVDNWAATRPTPARHYMLPVSQKHRYKPNRRRGHARAR